MNNQESKKRFFEYGFPVGFLPSGSLRSIADVAGVTVGHVTKIEGDDIRTGVTVIDPGIKDLYNNKIPAAYYAGNGTGKVAGSAQIEELGVLEAPIALASTLYVGTVTRGMIELVLSQKLLTLPQTVNVFVGECNDGILNNIYKNPLVEDDVRVAYENRLAQFAIGSVGAGTGTRAFSWKGGIGTASRIIEIAGKSYTIGALVQTNYGGAPEVLGIPIGKLLDKTDYKGIVPDTDGSCMIVLATNAPLTARQLRRLAKRGFMGLAKTGTIMRTVSGDFAVAFSTSRDGVEGSGSVGKCIADDDLTGIFLAAAEAVEESVYDALFAGETMVGRSGNTLEAAPVDTIISLLEKYHEK